MKLNETIEFHIKTTSLALTRMYNSIAANDDITQTMGYVLVYVEKEGTPSTKLAEELGMKKSSLTRLLKKMDDKGYIYREVDKSDKRIVKVFLSPKGIQKRKLAKEIVLDFNMKLFKLAEQEELDLFFNICKLVKEQADTEMNSTT